MECLVTDGCDGWSSIGECYPNCMFAPQDVGCFGGGNTASVEEICDISNTQIIEHEICSIKDDCTSCVTTILSDGVRTCQWFSFSSQFDEDEDANTNNSNNNGGYCNSACDMNGCGVTTCPSTSDGEDVGGEDGGGEVGGDGGTVDGGTTTTNTTQAPSSKVSLTYCEGFTTCVSCLISGSCAWAPVIGCIDSCNMIADTACYDGGSIEGDGDDNMDGSDVTSTSKRAGENNNPPKTTFEVSDICNTITTDQTNYELCMEANDCVTCVETSYLSSDDVTVYPCQWFFPSDDGNGEGYCSNQCDMNGNCGTGTCSSEDRGGIDSSAVKCTTIPLLYSLVSFVFAFFVVTI